MGRITIPRAKYGPPARAGKAKPPWPGYMTRDRRALAGFGSAMLSLGDRLGSIINNQLIQAEFSEGKAALQRSENEFFENAVDDPEYEKLSEKYNKDSKKWQEEIVSKYKTPGAQSALKNMITANAPKMEATLNGIIKGKAQEDALRKVSDSIESFIPSAGAIPEELELGIINATSAAQGAVVAGTLTKDQAEEQVIFSLMEDWPEKALEQIDASSLDSRRKIQLRSQANVRINLLKAFFAESIKPDLIAAISVNNNREDGYKVLDASTAQLVKDGILTKPEAAETNKRLGDWIDNYVSGRIKAAKEADKLTTIQSYQKLSKPILNGELTYDGIDESDLRQTRRSGESVSDAERWRTYIKGSYKDAPNKNAPEGHTVSFAAVYDVATLQLSPKEGYDVLLEARFVDGSITNEQFEWAVDKIENPYQRHVLEDLNATMKSNLEDFNRLFSSDNERNKKVNEALISWADELIKKEKVPSKKEMFAMSSAFRVGGGQPYDIGRVIERGGIEWEIVGFDENGEPLVEEVP